MDNVGPECLVCMADVASCLLHCGHALCAPCINNLGALHRPPHLECPSCRRPVIHRPIVYLAIDRDPAATNRILDALWTATGGGVATEALAASASASDARALEAARAAVRAAEARARAAEIAAANARAAAAAAVAEAAAAAVAPLSRSALHRLAIANHDAVPLDDAKTRRFEIVRPPHLLLNRNTNLATDTAAIPLPEGRRLYRYTDGPIYVVLRVHRVFAKEDAYTKGMRTHIRCVAPDGVANPLALIAGVEAAAAAATHGNLHSELTPNGADGLAAHWWIASSATDAEFRSALVLACVGVERSRADVACCRWHVVGHAPGG